MKLEQMYQDFNSMSEQAQTLFVREYRSRRAMELTIPQTYTKKKKEPTGPQLSEEDKALLRKFGITQKTLSNLQVDEEIEDEGSFEFGDTYELDEEEAN